MRSLVLPAEKSSSEGNLSAMISVKLRWKQSLDRMVRTIEWLDVVLKWNGRVGAEVLKEFVKCTI